MEKEKINQEAVRRRLLDLAEPEYQEFHSKLVPGEENILGVRLPKMRVLARELAKKDWEDWFLGASDVYYEETMVRGLVLAYGKLDVRTKLDYVRAFVKDIHNWAVCDSFCNTLKDADKYPDIYWDFLEPYFDSDKEYEARFGAVMLLSHFVKEEYREEALERLKRVRQDGYYAKMGVAWAISVYFAAFPEEMLAYLKGDHGLEDFTYRKSLQKITESYRVSKEMKAITKEMRQRG